jgi:hypothetical protein
MYSIKDAYTPQRNSFREPYNFTEEALRQERLQRLDPEKRPYAFFGWEGDDVDPLPNCITAMDYLLNNPDQDME